VIKSPSFQPPRPRQPRRHGARLDSALLELARVVTAPDWSVDSAAARLQSAAGGDQRILRHLRARVARDQLQRRTRLGTRAARSLDRALAGQPVPLTA